MTTRRVESAAEAASFIRPSDSVAIGLGPAHPTALLHALGERDDWVDLQMFGALLTDLYSIFSNPNVRYRSGFYGPAERFLVDSGANVEYVPADFRRFAPIIERLAPRVLATAAAMPDADGFCSLSVHAGATVDALHAAGADPDRLLIVECSPHFPRTMGLMPDHPHRLHVDEIDVLFTSEASPVDLPDEEPSEADRAIAAHALGFIPDGATIQTGIGSIPSLIATELCDAPGGGYGIHSEMFTTGLMKLHQAGKVSNLNKGTFPGVSITTFAAGTAAMYEWLDDNSMVRFLPVAVVNSANTIAHNDNFVSILGATAVDLYSQVAADTIRGRQHSGTGGHEDFLAGAGLQSDDASLLCLRSTSTVDGKLTSRILPWFQTGTTVTTPRHHVDRIITEYGIAELAGKTVRERARELVRIAHPNFRDELSEAAEQIR
ncbi:MAG TPA: acetyl-CoA hydrolase/transferase C-terminal domain-containing protein [Microthrixaceae bacterium]|nr:acetyl-CoA hydrolase/transferase C-terminal domain-containing protein [Microthrixaceae bacterium]